MSALDPIEFLSDVQAVAARSGHPECVVKGGQLHIPAAHPGGVGVRVIAVRGGWRLVFDCITVVSSDPADVSAFVQSALDGELRVRVDARGGKPFQWSLEIMGETGDWRELHSQGLINWRFWGNSETQYLCNASTGRALRDLAERSNVTVETRQRVNPAA